MLVLVGEGRGSENSEKCGANISYLRPMFRRVRPQVIANSQALFVPEDTRMIAKSRELT